jgi:hypothetical protein
MRIGRLPKKRLAIRAGIPVSSRCVPRRPIPPLYDVALPTLCFVASYATPSTDGEDLVENRLFICLLASSRKNSDPLGIGRFASHHSVRAVAHQSRNQFQNTPASFDGHQVVNHTQFGRRALGSPHRQGYRTNKYQVQKENITFRNNQSIDSVRRFPVQSTQSFTCRLHRDAKSLPLRIIDQIRFSELALLGNSIRVRSVPLTRSAVIPLGLIVHPSPI